MLDGIHQVNIKKESKIVRLKQIIYDLCFYINTNSNGREI